MESEIIYGWNYKGVKLCKCAIIHAKVKLCMYKIKQCGSTYVSMSQLLKVIQVIHDVFLGLIILIA